MNISRTTPRLGPNDNAELWSDCNNSRPRVRSRSSIFAAAILYSISHTQRICRNWSSRMSTWQHNIKEWLSNVPVHVCRKTGFEAKPGGDSLSVTSSFCTNALVNLVVSLLGRLVNYYSVRTKAMLVRRHKLQSVVWICIAARHYHDGRVLGGDSANTMAAAYYTIRTIINREWTIH